MKFLLSVVTILFLAACSESDESKANSKILIQMEAAMQEANLTAIYRGSAEISEVESETMGIYRYSAPNPKADRLSEIFKKMQRIDDLSGKIVLRIDKIRLGLIKLSGENLSSRNILRQDAGYVYPSLLNLEELKNPTAETNFSNKDISSKIYKYTTELMRYVATYTSGDNEFELKPIKEIKNYKEGADLYQGMTKQLMKQPSVNQMEDLEILAEIYKMGVLSRDKAKNHKGTTLIEHLAMLSVLQNDVLNMRAMALSHWKSRVSTDGYRFNKMSTVVTGPNKIVAGQDVDFEVSVMAIDIDATPRIKLINAPKHTVEIEDGVAKIHIDNPKAGELKLKGTISTQSKSGVWKSKNWEKTIIIEKPR